MQWQPTPVLLAGKSHGRRSLVGCSPWGREESDTTKQFHFHFSLSCIGEGNGNPLHCFCLEDPRDCGAWWATLCGVALSRTQLNDFHFHFCCKITIFLTSGNHCTVKKWRSLDLNMVIGIESKYSSSLYHFSS